MTDLRIAIHEAAHAFTMRALKLRSGDVFVTPYDGGAVHHETEALPPAVWLAGVAAELEFYGSVEGGAYDLEQVNGAARDLLDQVRHLIRLNRATIVKIAAALTLAPDMRLSGAEIDALMKE
jgi:hypothetical protein